MAFLILIVFSVLAWLVLILPRQRELKRHQALMGQLDVGDDVMMASGMYGVIRAIDGDYVQLEIADGLQIKIAKRSIAARVDEPIVDGPVVDGLPGADSVTDGTIGQTPDSEGQAGLDQGDGGVEAVIDLDGDIDSVQRNEE